ncbi:hypothetical protein [Promicromonospora sukumoe]|uniref:hypothetical protein n=1 Tax=Promicromonospora sukumoe TaxID=88382 RepID=UPI000379980F|nr:hypothetical protein [Promicromonospora sukumoe]
MDETKAGRFIVVVAAVSTAVLGVARKDLRQQLRAGQRSLHFTKESNSSRRAVLKIIADLPIEVTVYRVSGKHGSRESRERCIRALARDAVNARPRRIVLERDDSLQVHDERWLYEELGPGNRRDTEYLHLNRHDDPMLWVPDAIAWCIQKGRPWLDEVANVIVRTVDLP